MKNTLEDLNNHLFAQIERLSDESLAGEGLETELKRSKAVSDIACQIVSNGKLALEVQKALGDGQANKMHKWLEAK